jgi:signal transduction histidine kinase
MATELTSAGTAAPAHPPRPRWRVPERLLPSALLPTALPPTASLPGVLAPGLSARAPGASAEGPATYAMRRIAAWFACALRDAVALVGGVAALVGVAPPASLGWVLPAVAVNVGWAALFTFVALTRGLRAWLVTVEVLVTTALCVLHGHLTAADALPAGAGWVTVLASMTVVVANFAWPVSAALPAGLVVVAGYLVGAALADLPDRGAVQGAILAVQACLAGVLMALIRRATAQADRALDGYERVRRAAEVASARRAHEREENRRLHDTVLATLTIVGTGAIDRGSATLRERAIADLAVIDALGRAAQADADHGRLDQRLREVAAQAPVALEVELSLLPCVVPGEVAEAFAGAAGQALVNVARHAGVHAAEVRLGRQEDEVRVEVIDRGRGFDPGRVPAHRYGLREAIRGRMRAVGGEAGVDSSPGQGTRITLTWPAARPAGTARAGGGAIGGGAASSGMGAAGTGAGGRDG